MGGATDFTHYTVVYTIGNLSSRSVRVTGRSTTSYMVTGVTGANVGDSIIWRVSSAHLFIDDDDNEQGSSFPVGNGMGTMQACPGGDPTDTFTPAPGCNAPLNLRQSSFNPVTFAQTLTWNAPSGGSTVTSYEGQWRETTSTTGPWNNLFTVDDIIRSYTIGGQLTDANRRFQYRVFAVCGSASSPSSNISTFTYPGSTATNTHTPVPSNCQPPRNMTFDRYVASTNSIFFDFDAPVSGGLNLLHYQPEYRRLPSTIWTNVGFTRAADQTNWGVIFTDESFTEGRTLEFRLVAICTGNVESVPSNVVSYTYPGSTPTNTNTPSGPTATNTNTPTRTSTPTPTHTVPPTTCNPPRNMTFNRYNTSNRFIYFDFDAPLSGGLNRLHYQPQYRRLPSTGWTDMSFTVAANRTNWAVIFNNESFTIGRTIEFRLLSVCTGNVRSNPSNVVSYTYPGPTQTNTPSAPLECQPARNMTFNRYQDSDVSIYFDFDAPFSGGLSRLHFQPQYRRLPSVVWIDPAFTVAANRTDWNVRFSNDLLTSGRTYEFRLISVCTGNVESIPSNVVSYTFPGPTLTPTYTNTPTVTPTITTVPPPSFCPAPTGLRFLSLTGDGARVAWNPVNYNIQCQASNLRYTSTHPNDVQVEWDNPPHITQGRYSYGYGGSSFFEPFVTATNAQPGARRIEVFQLEVQTRCSDGTEGTAVTSLLQFDYGRRSDEPGAVSDLPDQSSWPYGPPQDLRVTGSEEKYLRLSWTAPEQGIPDGYRWEVRLNGSVANTSETSALSATVPNTSGPGDELTITVYSLYDHPEFGRIEYLVRAIIERDGDGQIAPRSPTGYSLSWSFNGEEFFEPSFPYSIYIHDILLGQFLIPGDRIQLRLQTLCTESPEPIVSNFVFSSIMTVPDHTPTPTETPFGTPPPTPTDDPGYSSYTNPVRDLDDVRLEWTNPSNLSYISLSGTGAGGDADEPPFISDFYLDLTRFNTNNITFQLVVFTSCTDGSE